VILISHRGNISGKNPALENSPQYIIEALNMGYDVEIDVWYVGEKFFLGHDNPQYEIDESFLLTTGLWCHAKNISALNRMVEIGAHCFWHQTDDVTLTSKGFLWTYPGVDLLDNSICVLPEISRYDKIDCAGLCSDEIEKYREES
tara:strand:- start:227 stop:661 length:435 start_codon:yes stop_codon:yes gene_type:complete